MKNIKKNKKKKKRKRSDGHETGHNLSTFVDESEPATLFLLGLGAVILRKTRISAIRRPVE